MNLKSKKNKLLILLSLVFILSIAAFFYIQSTQAERNNFAKTITDPNPNKANIVDSSGIYSKEYIKAILDSSSSDSNVQVILYSNYDDYLKAVVEDSVAGKNIQKQYHGKRINIAVTGVDSRLGDSYKHADANHIISILADSGRIEIISIPRDTYADAGFEDSTGQNKLTVFRAARGRKSYLNEIASIANLDKIHYYIEFGFSQAIGLIELLGYKNAVSTLRVLRSRTGLGGDDYQRVYNQSQFIRQNITNRWGLFNSFSGEILIRAGLLLTESNLTYDKVIEIREELNTHGFSSKTNIEIRIKPPIPIKYKVFELTNPEVIAALSSKISSFNQHHYGDSVIHNKDVGGKVSHILMRDINNSINSNFKGNSLRKLNIYFEQKAWLQIDNISERDSVRELLCNTLINYYTKRKDMDKANAIKNYLEIEKKSFKLKNTVKFEKIF